MFNPRWIVGKIIARVDMNPFDAAKGRGTAHDPVIHFTDGSYITFFTEETEKGVYGTDIRYHAGCKLKKTC